MTATTHGLQTESEGLHQLHNWTYADAATRTGASGFVATDLYKIALQLDTNSLWMLTALTPTWVELTNTTGSGLSLDATLDANLLNLAASVLSLDTQAANLVFSGPTTGGAAAPSFRSLVANDIPSLDAAKITTGQMALARGGTASDLSATGPALIRQATGGAALTALKCNFAASSAPGVSDDSGAGYAVGSRWLDTTNDKEYVCLDATVSAAVWTETTQGVAGGGTGEIFLTAAGGWPSTTNGCAAPAKTEYGTNDIDLYSLDFDQTTIEYAQWSVWMPDNWNAGTVTFKALWTAASGSGNVEWELQGRAYANDDAIDQAWGAAQAVIDTLLATGDMHVSPTSGAITLGGTPAAGQFVQFRLARDTGTASNLAADAKLLGVKVYYTKS